MFWGTGRGLFLCFRVRDTKIFCVFMVRDMNFFWEKNLSNYIYRHSELSSLLTENYFLNPMVR